MLTRLLTLIVLSLLSVGCFAAKPYEDPYKAYEEADHFIDDMDLNMTYPAVDKSERNDVRKYMRNLKKDLVKRNYKAELVRDDEVVVIELPSDALFLPNDTLLWTGRASRLLDPLKSFFSDPDFFKIIISVNTDNTGSEAYNMQLAEARASSMNDWFESNSAPDLVYVSYAWGDQDPIMPNNTRDGRKANRRVELYLIPGPKLIDLAHQKKLIK